MSRPAAVTFETVRELAHAFPGVEDGTSYGTAALRVKKKFMARLREDGDSVVFRVGFDERE
ncbi:MAG: MmcQ/YjbR family DNA-binding protein, partial [Thermoanaerobaculia bacterium]